MKTIILLVLITISASAVRSQPDSTQVNSQLKKEAITLNDSVFNSGVQAAKKYYKGYKVAAGTTLAVTILNPLIGLAPAIGTTVGKPGDLMHPDYEMLKNPVYYNGYISESKKIQTRKVWNKYLLGVGIDIAVISIIYGSILLAK